MDAELMGTIPRQAEAFRIVGDKLDSHICFSFWGWGLAKAKGPAVVPGLACSVGEGWFMGTGGGPEDRTGVHRKLDARPRFRRDGSDGGPPVGRVGTHIETCCEQPDEHRFRDAERVRKHGGGNQVDLRGVDADADQAAAPADHLLKGGGPPRAVDNHALGRTCFPQGGCGEPDGGDLGRFHSAAGRPDHPVACDEGEAVAGGVMIDRYGRARLTGQPPGGGDGWGLHHGMSGRVGG